MVKFIPILGNVVAQLGKQLPKWGHTHDETSWFMGSADPSYCFTFSIRPVFRVNVAVKKLVPGKLKKFPKYLLLHARARADFTGRCHNSLESDPTRPAWCQSSAFALAQRRWPVSSRSWFGLSGNFFKAWAIILSNGQLLFQWNEPKFRRSFCTGQNVSI